MKKCDVGGQAVIEGVMMRGKKGLATAVRKSDGEIVVKYETTVPLTKKYKFFDIPFLRGFFILGDSLITGIKTLNYSAEFFEDTEPSKFEDWLRAKFGDKSNDVIVGITFTISIIFSMGLFFLLPTLIASLFKGFGLSTIGLNVVEAITRIVILLGYIYGISKMEDIFRVFQYHGAEHKTIFCYESEEELTVENVKKHSRFHPRCGTNFLFLIMFVSIIIFSLTGWGSVWERMGLRIILIPLVSGITYEIIKWLGSNENKLARAIAAPGLKLQGLTTKEPDDEQIEVAIAALMAAEGIKPREKTIMELLNIGKETLKNVDIETYILDTQLLLGKVLQRDKIYLLTNGSEKVSVDKEKEFMTLINKREEKMPIKYILGEAEFMGFDFKVEEGVLIPRGDTEILVEEVLKHIEDQEEINICDLCCGTGAIGISLAKLRKNIKVELIDYFDIPEKVTLFNLEKHELGDRGVFTKSNLLEKVINEGKKYEILVSNPPYIKKEVIETLMEDVKNFEPHTALDGGEDGLIFYRKIVEQSKLVLEGRAILAFEIGHDQGLEVMELMEKNNYVNVKIVKDLAGLDRVVIGKLNL